MEFGPLVSWVAVVPTAVGASVALYQARKSRKSAQDATEALGMAIRPIFAFGWNDPEANDSGLITVEASNMGQFDAIDVEVWAGLDGRTARSSGASPRLKGRVPGTLDGGETLYLEDALRFADIDAENTIVVTARFSDERGIQRWEQQGRIIVGIDPSPQGARVVSRKFEQGTPVKYTSTRGTDAQA